MCEIAKKNTYCPFRVGGTRTTPTDWGYFFENGTKKKSL